MKQITHIFLEGESPTLKYQKTDNRCWDIYEIYKSVSNMQETRHFVRISV